MLVVFAGLLACLFVTTHGATPSAGPREFYDAVESLTNHHLLRDAEALHLHAHRFRLPRPLDDIVFCVPQKNGNRYFASLMHVLHFGGPPRSVADMLKRMPEYDYSMPGPTDRVWMLARNPYSRVLSLYLHKVAGLCKFGSLGCQDIGEQMKFAGILGYNASAPPSFAAWVDLLATVMVRLQEHGIDPCMVDKHFCSQASGCAWRGAKEVMVLRVEEQWKWFQPLVSLLSSVGLQRDSLVGHGWKPFTGMPCFYAPAGNCSDMARTRTPPLVDHIHGTGASGSICEHYTPRAMILIQSVYAGDFSLLGARPSAVSVEKARIACGPMAFPAAGYDDSLSCR
ncbi:unnamed protein product [Symbiodinium natans]|uniref:Uncharacterized protein n=1 Tax=Symbiodinium natans TaxID=878477 RepID=A0A812RCR3_9DINO|nr:unnamed protein product [Symbiodinium natans]